MLKKFGLVILGLVLIPSVVFATMVDTKVSANTVTYNSVFLEVGRGPQIVTLNSVTNHIRLINLSPFVDCYADIKCTDSQGGTGYATYQTMNILLPRLGSATPNTVELNFSTKNLAFAAVSNNSVASLNETVNCLKIHYIVTGDVKDF